LIRSKTKRTLRDNESLTDIQQFEEFLLIIPAKSTSSSNHQTRGPTEKEILVKTRHLPRVVPSPTSSNVDMSIDTAFFQGDLHQDLRKILSEIAKYSAFVISTLPFAEKLIKYYRQKIIMSLSKKQDIERCLINMGFSRHNVKRALKLHGNNYTSALDWLVENVSKNSCSSQNVSVESIEDEMSDSSYKKLCNRTFPSTTTNSTSSIFHTKHKTAGNVSGFSCLFSFRILRIYLWIIERNICEKDYFVVYRFC
jgi:hypothetical protein